MKVALIVVLYIFIEMYLLIEIGGAIGSVMTFFSFFGTAILGVIILRMYKSIFSQSMMSVMQGAISMQQLVRSNMLSLLGALLLILPGFFSDAVGVVMQIAFVVLTIKHKLSPPHTHENPYNTNQTQKGEEDVIEVEIVEHTRSSK